MTTHTLQMLTTQPKKKRAANRKKHLQIKKTLSSIWQRTRCKRSQHNQKRNALQIKCIWLCCEHLQCVSLFVCVVSICSVCLYLFVLSKWWKCFLDLLVLFLFACVFWSCSALSSLSHRRCFYPKRLTNEEYKWFIIKKQFNVSLLKNKKNRTHLKPLYGNV